MKRLQRTCAQLQFISKNDYFSVKIIVAKIFSIIRVDIRCRTRITQQVSYPKREETLSMYQNKLYSKWISQGQLFDQLESIDSLTF